MRFYSNKIFEDIKTNEIFCCGEFMCSNNHEKD